ncbi:hypothetical protein B0A55_13019, partial [Friedmanniomyces simplex]
GKYIADENLKGWTDSELGWPEEWELRANQVEIVEEDDAFDYWKTWDEFQIEQRLEGHLREPTVEELEADEAHAASPPDSVEPGPRAPRAPRAPADQVNVEPAEWKPQPRFPMRNYPPGDISEADFTLDGAADIDAAYSPKWSPDEQFGTEIEQVEKPGMKISGNPNPTPEEFEEAYKNDDPVAKAQMEDYKIQSPSGLPGSADEVAEEAGIPEEVAEELVEDGSIEVFAEEAVVGVVEGVMDFMILLPNVTTFCRRPQVILRLAATRLSWICWVYARKGDPLDFWGLPNNLESQVYLNRVYYERMKDSPEILGVQDGEDLKAIDEDNRGYGHAQA